MAAKKENTTKVKKWVVTVKDNPDFVGRGAGGIQFANGKAEVNSERMARWFREHPGYEVKEIVEEVKEDGDGSAE